MVARPSGVTAPLLSPKTWARVGCFNRRAFFFSAANQKFRAAAAGWARWAPRRGESGRHSRLRTNTGLTRRRKQHPHTFWRQS